MATERKTSSSRRAQRRERLRRSLLIATVLGVAAAAMSPGTTWHLLGAAVLAWAWLAFLGSASARQDSGAARHEAPLFGREQLIAIGNQMLARCRSRSQPFTVALVELTELPELRKLFGRSTEDEIVAMAELKLRTVATSRGLAVRTGYTQFSLLLPGRHAQDALQGLRTALGRAGCLEHDVGGEELVLLPNVKLDAVGPEHTGIGATYHELCQAMAAMHPRLPTTATPTSNLPTVPSPLRARDDTHRTPPVLIPTVPLPL
jgi:GGDEF domain-containing protein